MIEFAARHLRLNTYAIGVSLGPFASSREQAAVRERLCTLRGLVLRDERSYELALEMQLPYEPIFAADLAFLLPEFCDTPTPAESDIPTLGVSICGFESHRGLPVEPERRREERLTAALCELAQRRPVRFRMFVICDNPLTGDAAPTNRLAERLSKYAEVDVLPYDRGPLATYRRISECNAVCSVRLHGAVLAHVAGRPFALVEYHGKCTDYLDDVDYPEEFRIGDADTDEMSSRIEGLLDWKGPFLDTSVLNRLAWKNVRKPGSIAPPRSGDTSETGIPGQLAKAA